MGTAQQEFPVAKFSAASFDVSLTREEVLDLVCALELFRDHQRAFCSQSDTLTLLKEFQEAIGTKG
jgi:hypothetical protein